MQKTMQWGFGDGVDGSRPERVERSAGRRLSSDLGRGGADQSSKQRCGATCSNKREGARGEVRKRVNRGERGGEARWIWRGGENICGGEGGSDKAERESWRPYPPPSPASGSGGDRAL